MVYKHLKKGQALKNNIRRILLSSIVAGTSLEINALEDSIHFDFIDSEYSQYEPGKDLGPQKSPLRGSKKSTFKNYFETGLPPAIISENIAIIDAIESSDHYAKIRAFENYITVYTSELKKVGLVLSPLQESFLDARIKYLKKSDLQYANEQLIHLLNGGFSEISSTNPTDIR
jgi:hypothetical protein